LKWSKFPIAYIWLLVCRLSGRTGYNEQIHLHFTQGTQGIAGKELSGKRLEPLLDQAWRIRQTTDSPPHSWQLASCSDILSLILMSFNPMGRLYTPTSPGSFWVQNWFSTYTYAASNSCVCFSARHVLSALLTVNLQEMISSPFYRCGIKVQRG
jgi:hypothetical protein